MTAPGPSPEPCRGYVGAEPGGTGAAAAAEPLEWRDLAVPMTPAVPHLVMTRPVWEAPEPEAEP